MVLEKGYFSNSSMLNLSIYLNIGVEMTKSGFSCKISTTRKTVVWNNNCCQG